MLLAEIRGGRGVLSPAAAGAVRGLRDGCVQAAREHGATERGATAVSNN